MELYDENAIKDIVENVDILDYIGQSIELRPKGRKDYFGRCPLHVDRTPSFSVTPESHKFYCFGCGRGGTIVQYLIDYEGLKYRDAVKKAAELSGKNLSMMCMSETVKINRRVKREIEELSSLSGEHKILPEETFSQYKIGRIPLWEEEGISYDTIRDFDIRIDTKSNRIVYPVRDILGRLINVKGRTMIPDYKRLGVNKYMNYFPVGDMNYFQCYEKTLPYVEESRELIIFESIKSVMKLWDFGKKNSVSAEKHTLTDEQIRLIISNHNIDSVVLAYDSDVDYNREEKVLENIRILKRFVNLYKIVDRENLLGGKEAKNSPIDMGENVWNKLYENKVRIK